MKIFSIINNKNYTMEKSFSEEKISKNERYNTFISFSDSSLLTTVKRVKFLEKHADRQAISETLSPQKMKRSFSKELLKNY